MWLLLSIHYQIKSFTLKNTTTLNYEILLIIIIFLIYKQEMMVEIIFFNEIKTPVGASSERFLTVTVPPVGRLALFFSLYFFPIKYFSNHHKLYIIWKLKTSKFILWKPFWNRILRYHGNGTLKSFGGLLPLSVKCHITQCITVF